MKISSAQKETRQNDKSVNLEKLSQKIERNIEKIQKLNDKIILNNTK